MTSVIRANFWQDSAGVVQPTVIQVVSASDRDYRSASVAANSELNWVSLSITRKLPTSRIFIIFSGQYGTSNANDCSTRLVSSLDGYLGGGTVGGSRDFNSIHSPGTDKGYGQTAGSGTYSMIPSAFSFLYTPSNSTLSITLTTRIWVEAASTVYPNGDGWRGGDLQAHNTGAQIILMEIGG
jgi:hypothetical protein